MTTLVPATAEPRSGLSGKRVAVMQPYFFPYAGYFRLFAAVDEFVIYDCVQFPRRGRVHRTRIQRSSGVPAWLTLPLARQPRDTRITDLRFAPGARYEFDRRLRRLPTPRAAMASGAPRLLEFLHRPLRDVVDYLETGLRLVCELLDLPCQAVRSSSLDLDPSLRAQERVLAIAEARGATAYVNPPGGHHLYDPDAFQDLGMELRFLTPYDGPYRHLLPALMTTEPAVVAADIWATTEIAEPSEAGARPMEPAADTRTHVGSQLATVPSVPVARR